MNTPTREAATWVPLTIIDMPEAVTGIEYYVDEMSGKILAEVSSAFINKGRSFIGSSATVFDTRRAGEPVRVASYVDVASAKRAAEQMIWGDAKHMADKILRGESQ